MNGNNNKSEKLSLFLLGNSAVGKSTFINKYVNDSFSEKTLSTIGTEFAFKTMKLPTGEDIILEFCDTAGMEAYRAISFNLIKRANGIFLLYDITERESFHKINNWIESIRDIKEDNFPVILIGNKCDKEEERDIDKEEGQKLAEKNGFPFFETSCKEGNNIEESVKLLVFDIIEKIKLERLKEIEEGENGNVPNENRKSFIIAKNKTHEQNKKECC